MMITHAPVTATAVRSMASDRDRVYNRRNDEEGKHHVKTILITTFEIGHIASGYDMTCGTLDGEKFNVRGPVLKDDAGHNPGDLPSVELGFDQLRAIATGGGAVFGFVSVNDDSVTWIDQVHLRLPTLAEYRQVLDLNAEWSKENGIPHPGFPSDEEILPLITPVVL